jgi:putative Holliday junction resolvase
VGRILAIDPGERRLGLALSDPTGKIALPFAVRRREGWAADVAYLRSVIAAHDVTLVVVGRPLTGRGTEGPAAREAARFASRLRGALAVPVHEVDERFSTVGADRALRESGRRGRQRRGYRDAVAAALILQPYLDRRAAAEPLRGPNEGVMLAP